MDALPSTEFRKRYASLTEPTAVTVNGHTIGVWTPGIPWKMVMQGIAEATKPGVDLEEEVRHLKAELAKRPHEPIGRVTAVRDVIGPSGRGLVVEAERFNTRPFTPVPKVKR